MISCSIEWYSKDINVISYNITIFLFVFFIPLIMLIVINIRLILIVKKNLTLNHSISFFIHIFVIIQIRNKRSSTAYTNAQVKKRYVILRDVSFMVIGIVGMLKSINLFIFLFFFLNTFSFKVCFILSWSPYALISLYRTFFDYSNSITPLMATIPALFAKSSLIWPSLLNIIGNKTMRSTFSCK